MSYRTEVERRFDVRTQIDDFGSFTFYHRGEKWRVWSTLEGWHVDRECIETKDSIEDLCGAVEASIQEVEKIRGKVEELVGDVEKMDWKYGSSGGAMKTEKVTIRGWGGEKTWEVITETPDGESIRVRGESIGEAMEDLREKAREHIEDWLEDL